MKDHNDGNQPEVIISNQNIQELLQRGRILHDRAVYEIFTDLAGKVRLQLKKLMTITSGDGKVTCQDSGKLYFRR